VNGWAAGIITSVGADTSALNENDNAPAAPSSFDLNSVLLVTGVESQDGTQLRRIMHVTLPSQLPQDVVRRDFLTTLHYADSAVRQFCAQYMQA